jgi:saccharopine dehydrogenase-like NADP-dependent oxidoreductase
MHPTTVLLLGGYGFFGTRLAQLLSRIEALHVIVAGRDLASAQAVVSPLMPESRARLSAASIDARDDRLADKVTALGATVVVNLAGPFQGQDYHIAQACITARASYIDLADSRRFVCGIGALDEQARAAGILVTSGASSVPALSSAVVEHLARAMTQVHDIDVGITPGNRTDRGLATVAAILSYCGEPISVWRDQRWEAADGWIGHERRHYPEPVGPRWLTLCEVPDLSLLVGKYPECRSVTFRAGLELPALHFGLGGMSILRRFGLVPRLTHFARFARWASERLIGFGSDHGAMHVEVSGIDTSGNAIRRRWTLLAEDGDGPYVPTLAAATLVRQLASGTMQVGRAMPCVGLLTLADFQREIGQLHIHTQEEPF